MKILLSLLMLGGIASAGPVYCATGTLATYEALGSTGCMIGSVTVGSFGAVPGTGGATAIDPTDVIVTPSGGTTDPALTFSVDMNAATNMLLESIFTYQISGASFTSDALNLSNSSETGDGAVTDLQNYCIGGTFGPDGVDGCGTTTGGLLGLDGVQNMDSTSFPGAAFLSITDDFTLDGGTDGSAAGGTFSDSFTATSTSSTPEPGAFLLCGAGMAFLGLKALKARGAGHE